MSEKTDLQAVLKKEKPVIAGQNLILEDLEIPNSLKALRLYRCELENGSFNQASLEHVVLESSFMVGVDCAETKWQHCSAIRHGFQNCSFQKAVFKDCDFSGGEYLGVDFREAHFENVDMAICGFSNVSFKGATFVRCNFNGSFFEDVDMRGVHVEQGEFQDVLGLEPHVRSSLRARGAAVSLPVEDAFWGALESLWNRPRSLLHWTVCYGVFTGLSLTFLPQGIILLWQSLQIPANPFFKAWHYLFPM